MRKPSVKTLRTAFGIDRETACTIREAMELPQGLDSRSAEHGWAIEQAMCAISGLLDMHGVESLRADEYSDLPHDAFWWDTVALYCNAGDTYVATIVYDVLRGTFRVTSFGDWVETAERARRLRVR
jgi:hypothetical protein